MQLLFFTVVGLMMVGSVSTIAMQRKMDAPQAVIAASSQVDMYRMFMYVAARYMSTYTGGAATLTWDTLKTASGAPSGAVNAQMPPTWKVVVSNDKTWVACTQMDERAVGAIHQLATAGTQSLIRTEVTGREFIVVGTQADTAKAVQC